jgi:WD40-like Beta Propeller Repeat
VNQLERRLRRLEAPGEAAATLRAWELASVEFDRREPVARRTHQRRLWVLAIALLCVAALGISPAGAEVVRWVGDRIDANPGVGHAKPFLGPLPAQGRLLVTSDAGLWVVQRDGSKRLIGRYSDPAWSPHGLFIAAIRGHELVAMEPNGRVHWTVPASRRPALPSWSSDGYRIAYLSGFSLRLVNGDGTGDRLLAAHVDYVAPAWRPGLAHVLAWVSRGVTVADVDSGTTLARITRVEPVQVAWSPNGKRLLVVERGRVRLFDSRGHVRKELDLAAGVVAQRAAFSPDGRTVALLRRQSGLSEVRLLSVRGRSWNERAGAPVSGGFSTLEWSPDGRWLLLAWPTADQWLFVSPSRVLPVSGIGRAFASGPGWAFFPTLGGWCCSR